MALVPTQGQGLPFDLQTSQEAIARRRQLADALRAQSLQPRQGQMIGRHYIPSGALEALGQVGQAYMSRKMYEDTDAASRELSGQYNERLRSGLDDYFRTREGMRGTPGDPGSFIPTEDDIGYRTPPTPGTPSVAPNPRRAAVTALTSGLPALARVGQADLEAMSKGALTAKDLLGVSGASVASRVAAAQGLDPSQLRPDPRYERVGETLWEMPADGQGGPRLRLDTRPVFGAPFSMGGDLYQNETGRPPTADMPGVPGTGKIFKLDNAPNIKIDNSQNAGLRKIPESLAGEASKALTGFSQAAAASARGLSAIENLKRTIVPSEGGNVPFPNAAIFFGQLANAFGVRVDQAALANAETFQSEVTRMWADLMAANGGARGLVKEESERLMQSLPSLAQTPEGRMQIIQVLEQQMRANIQAARESGRLIGEAMRADDPAMLTDALVNAIQPPASTAVQPPAVRPNPGGRQPAGAPAGGWQPGQEIAPGFRVIQRIK